MRGAALVSIMVGIACACGHGGSDPAQRARAAETGEAANGSWLPGKTQPVPGRCSRIQPAVLHPVVEVMVKLGDKVKKDQPLVKLDDDEPQADVRSKRALHEELKASLARLKEEPRHEEQNEAKANLENLKIVTEESQQILDRLEPLFHRGAVAEQRYHDARHQVNKAKADRDAAAARLARLLKRPFDREVAELEARIKAAAENVKNAEAELEHYTVVSQIDGVVAALEVKLGMVSRPGTTDWGEVLDLSVIDVRCEVSPETADSLRTGQAAEVRANGRSTGGLSGKIAFVGIAADPKTGRIPVLVRLDNPEGRLRCYVDVEVRFN
ncbi:MAG TPA: efflux RND transporter periplasmic adaptor subunit [Gemmataceae bacterium]|nr:efflux RND transporter periplasmic adaptor subunit [Gemmataceae bacterium]